MSSLPPEQDALARAERHVREAEQRLVRQQMVVTELELQGHLQEAEVARELLTTFRQSLEVLRAPEPETFDARADAVMAVGVEFTNGDAPGYAKAPRA